MTQSEIAAVAADMLRELAAPGATGHAERILQDRARKPVYLGLTRRHDRITLVVGHRDSWPLLEDAAVIARHFGVGADAEARAQSARLPAQDGATVPIRGLVYTWIETAPTSGPATRVGTTA